MLNQINIMEEFDSLGPQSYSHDKVTTLSLSREKGRVNSYLKFLFVFCLVLVSFIDVQASHFRYGSISWRVVGPKTIEFKVSQAYRSGYFGNPEVGSTLVPDVDFSFGDGSSRDIPLLVTAVNEAQDWFYGVATFTHTYSEEGTYTANFSSCCRLVSLKNNSDLNYRVETTVQVGGGNNSPVATLPPIRTLPNDQMAATFPIPATDFEGDVLSYRLATSTEMGGGSNPEGLTVNPTTGFVTWTTMGLEDGLYNAAVAITDTKGAKIVVDFIISVQAVPPPPPAFDFTVTPTPSVPIEALVGQLVGFRIRATDDSETDLVTIFALGMPAGASLFPRIVLGNPVQTAFNWTPTTAGSYVVTFVAEDSSGNQTITSVTINVSSCVLTIEADASNVSSPGANDGAINLTVSGGTAPYTYNWSNGSTSEDLEGLAAGTYNVTVVDATGSCRQTASFTIQEEVACDLMLTGTVTHVSAPGAADGSIDLTVSGGIAPYTYTWSNGSTTEDVMGLMPGTYTVMVVDSTGACMQDTTFTIQGDTTMTCPDTGGISYELWSSVSSKLVELHHLPSDTPPTSTNTLSSFMIPSNMGENYFTRLRGYLCVPVSGEYRFYLAADDRAELLLSTDEDPANKMQIAWVRKATKPDKYTEFPTQQSEVIYLEAGRRYYIEAVMREFRFKDHLSVAWTKPDGMMETIPGSSLIPYMSAPMLSASQRSELKSALAEKPAQEAFIASPNPFSHKTNISFTVEAEGEVNLEVFNLQGQRLQALHAGRAIAGQTYQYQFDGSKYTNGVYICRFTVGGKSTIKRLVLNR
ncbi:T9SS type A sorting domain-containing protein [Sabulibacter ruber]|uniref:T9SS type A sorting domain-containing protein n=1 Tax=Sabulibacter ruber TaxID=2811901 RepID=UPI001A975ECE|nr:T9SS type A sorting domain-containing protein [Sabulibacter ruber]